MAISEVKFGTWDYFFGLSTDTKPSPSAGDFFIETDTNNQFVWNGTAWAPFNGNGGSLNKDSTILTLAAAAASTNSADQTNFNGKGLLVGVNITAITGTTPTLTVTIQGKDVASGSYYTLLASAALSVTGFTLLSVYPALTAAANTVANLVLPKTWRISTAIGGTTPAVTATIGASVIV